MITPTYYANELSHSLVILIIQTNKKTVFQKMWCITIYQKSSFLGCLIPLYDDIRESFYKYSLAMNHF